MTQAAEAFINGEYDLLKAHVNLLKATAAIEGFDPWAFAPGFFKESIVRVNTPGSVTMSILFGLFGSVATLLYLWAMDSLWFHPFKGEPRQKIYGLHYLIALLFNPQAPAQGESSSGAKLIAIPLFILKATLGFFLFFSFGLLLWKMPGLVTLYTELAIWTLLFSLVTLVVSILTAVDISYAAPNRGTSSKPFGTDSNMTIVVQEEDATDVTSTTQMRKQTDQIEWLELPDQPPSPPRQ
jgi:hypothetical protein